MENDFEKLEQTLGYRFDERTLLTRALTHPSFLHETRGENCGDYQRLEFLGDAVLGMLLAELLCEIFPDWDEGMLSKARAQLAAQNSLAEHARALGVGDYLLLGHGEVLTGGRDKNSILSDVLEALLAAVYLDGGLGAARTLVNRLFRERMELDLSTLPSDDSKSRLQEMLTLHGKPMPEYRLLEDSGPPHDRLFVYLVLVDGRVIGEGRGRSKKAAQQAAAAQALEMLLSSNSRDE